MESGCDSVGVVEPLATHAKRKMRNARPALQPAFQRAIRTLGIASVHPYQRLKIRKNTDGSVRLEALLHMVPFKIR